jgi:hypothetical protein
MEPKLGKTSREPPKRLMLFCIPRDTSDLAMLTGKNDYHFVGLAEIPCGENDCFTLADPHNLFSS